MNLERRKYSFFYGGGGGIRTHEAISDLLVFKTSAFNQTLPPLLFGLLILYEFQIDERF
jgi:hypothetical protein